MNYTPKQFAQLLLESSLNAEEQLALLGMLPRLTIKQIQKLAKGVETNVKKKKKILEQAQAKTEARSLRMQIELEKEAAKMKE